MTDIPESLKWGTVTGLFGSIGSDSVDDERAPDVTPLSGTVLLTPSVTWIQVPDEGSFYLDTVSAALIDGVLFSPDEPDTPGVPLVATQQPGMLPEVVQWTAAFVFDEVTVQPPPILFDVPDGGEVHLSSQLGVEEQVPYVTVISTEALAEAGAYADAAEVSALQANAARNTAQSAASASEAARTTAQSAAAASSTSAAAAASSATAAAAAQAALSSALAHLPYAMAQGVVTVSPTTVGESVSASVTFPVGRFTQAPRVLVNARSTDPAIGMSTSGSSASGVNIRLVRNLTLASTPIEWQATQMTASNADG